MSEFQAEGHEEETRGLIRHSQQKYPILKVIIGFLNYSVFWYCGVLWLLLVICFGGAYVLPLLGACTLSDCDSFLNLCNAILTGLFTAINIYVLPGRIARLLALASSKGVDGFGENVPSSDNPKNLLAESYDPSTFYHFSIGDKYILVILLLTSTLTQFINQVFHIIYSSYEDSITWPGVLWNNLFFLISLTTMVVAIAYEGLKENAARTSQPNMFPHTASTLIMGYMFKNKETA